MTIVSLDRLLPGGRFVGSRGSKSRLGEFARICRRRRSCDSFPNRPYGQRMLSCPRGNEGMSEDDDGNPIASTNSVADTVRSAFGTALTSWMSALYARRASLPEEARASLERMISQGGNYVLLTP